MDKLTPEEIKRIFNGFTGRKVLVIGDIMLDSYWWGQVERISPEAPVPIVNVTRREHRMGGAANVAMNIKSLGADPVVCAIAGDDMEGHALKDLIAEKGISTEGIVFSSKKPTTVKTRVIGNKNQLLRIDTEDDKFIGSQEEQEVIDKLSRMIPASELVIFEDYDKGLITKSIIAFTIKTAKERNIPVVVDPKKRNFLQYTEATLFKPNLRELAEGLKLDIDGRSPEAEIRGAATDLMQRLDLRYALITLSERGIYVSDRSAGKVIPAHIRNVSDVSGAGDTVVSVAGLALLAGANMEVMAALANLAGGLVCEKAGVVPIDKEELFDEALRELC